VEEFEAAGLYDPAVDANPGRLELLEWLDGQGFTIAEMLHAHQVVTVGLVSLATDRRLLGGELLTRRAAIELSGMSPDDFDETATAVGFVTIAAAPDGEIGFTAADAMMLAALGLFTSIYSRNEAIAVVRVMGSSVARIAEAAVSLYLQDIESPHVKAGGSELIQAQQSYERAGVLDTGTGEHLNSMLRRHTMQAVERTRRAASGFEERFDYRYAIGFVDLVGFTAISAKMSPQKLGEFVRDFESRAHNAVTNVGARVVKFIGDEVMFASPDADAACRAANALMSGFASASENILPRGGLAYGNVLLRGGDYFGSVVNLASRLVDEAVPRELLVTDELALAATQCEFESAGRRMVKGFANPISVSSFLTG
jgi:class 3 adenylate cyclase